MSDRCAFNCASCACRCEYWRARFEVEVDVEVEMELLGLVVWLEVEVGKIDGREDILF